MKNVDKKLFSVYKHTNLINGKVYIGITSKIPKRRWQNGTGYRTQQLFWRAIEKYGWDNFHSEVLFSNLSKEDACNKEIELISLYKSNNNNFGYNVSNGGESTRLGSKHSKESILKMSIAHKNMSDETKRKISMARKGVGHTEETKLKIGKNSWTKKNKGNIIFSEEHKQKLRISKKSYRKKVICIETGEIFNSICECAKKIKPT